MTITELPITGARLLAGAPARDARGSFEVFWEAADLAAVGISFAPANAHHSYNDRSGTLRGMHYQRAPHGQVKLVSCVRPSSWQRRAGEPFTFRAAAHTDL